MRWEPVLVSERRACINQKYSGGRACVTVRDVLILKSVGISQRCHWTGTCIIIGDVIGLEPVSTWVIIGGGESVSVRDVMG